jgi:hypothetical protein
MKKTVALLLLLLLSSCHQKITQKDISKLNGYWEIEKVVFADGTEKKYSYNGAYDYFQLKANEGFRKKVIPQLDGRFLVNNQSEKIEITFENDKVYINYTTPYAKWKEEVDALTDEKLVVTNVAKATYHYKKTAPVNILEDGKTTK